jgi:N-acetylmuramoyl-L-alanine amidase
VRIVQAYFTKHPCYNAKKKAITPVGIFVHSTGAVNRELRRYVDSAERLGKNQYNNHWNKDNATKCVHAFIGKAADGTLKIYQTLPWDHRCWGVGSGKKGSHNATHIQFEICEDGLTNEQYYNEAFNLAKELCVMLCRAFDIPADNIVGHYEAYQAGYGSNHGDPKNWQKKFGGSMAHFRADVKVLLNGENGLSDTVVVDGKEAITETVKPTQTAQKTATTGSEVVTMKPFARATKKKHR